MRSPTYRGRHHRSAPALSSAPTQPVPQVLSSEPRNVKALLRRATARGALGRTAEAAADLQVGPGARRRRRRDGLGQDPH